MSLSREKKLNIVMLNMSPYSDWQSGIVNRNYFVFKELEKNSNISQILAIDFLGYGIKRGVKGLLRNIKGYQGRGVMKGLFSHCDQINDKLSVYLCAYPLISRKKVLNDVQNLIKKLKMQENLVLWSFNPIFSDLFGRIGEKLVIFDTVDNWAEHASYIAHKNELLKNYKAVSEKADIIFTVSEELIDFYKSLGRSENVYWIPNGVEVGHFAKTIIEEKSHLKIKKPIIGYVGTVQERFDFDLFEYLAKENQDKNFVIIGPVWKGVLEKAKSLKKKHKNIWFLGRKNYAQSPQYLKQFTVAIIPHKINHFIKSTNPMKMYEYLACGLPVVSTRGAGVDMFKDYIYITNDFKNFSHYIDLAIKENSEELRQKRINAVKDHSWESRVKKMLDVIYP